MKLGNGLPAAEVEYRLCKSRRQALPTMRLCPVFALSFPPERLKKVTPMSITLKTYLFLVTAIVLETVATSSLKASREFTRLWFSLVVVVGYSGSYYCLTQVLKHMALGVAYAIWCALGIVLVALIGVAVYKQRLDAPAIIGMGLIVAGVVVINLFSKAIYQS